MQNILLQYIVSFMGRYWPSLLKYVPRMKDQSTSFIGLAMEILKIIFMCFSTMNRICAWQAERLEMASAYEPHGE